ncbi:DinB family protein [Paracidobacterium acidisoli]|nr:DinB family protein [Paracidobacterium acidisoli]MBT9331628.1 DinB family protein [Paracidobacterium acidisoli]
MKRLIWLAIAGLAAPLALSAQTTANPIVSSAREIYARQSKLIVAAAEEMPADKYSYHPTPDQWSFGKVTSHIAMSSYAVCSMLSGTAVPDGAKVSDTDSKDQIVAGVKAAFDFCDKALGGLQDSSLGDTITFFRGTHAPRARALFELTGDLQDHYSQQAGYLRLNGMLPPSAKPRK